MRISGQKRSDLYSAFSEEIMKLRIDIGMTERLDKEKLDEKLFKLEQKIWQNVKTTLNL